MNAPILLWLRRDLRLTDNPVMDWAARQGRPVIPVFVLDEVVAGWGAAPRWRLGLALGDFAARLDGIGSRLILRRGTASIVLPGLAAETGADIVAWAPLHAADEQDRDREVAEALDAAGVAVERHHGHTLWPPEAVKTGAGGYYKVFTPFWKAARQIDPGTPLAPVEALTPPGDWPAGDRLEDWSLGHDMRRGADVVGRHVRVGELAARERLVTFVEEGLDAYPEARDRLPEAQGTSTLSENLTYGEISARECWAAARRVGSGTGMETFCKELAWRDFAHHLAHHTPRLTRSNWKPDWDDFPWRGDSADAEAWRRGRTGLPVVDAAMREMFVTGRMHNRARMLVASYLTKHMLTHWRIGCDWFADCLVDWDPANNAMGWQWVAGSGPDASPFFRIFNPETQARKFDPKDVYQDRWVAEIAATPSDVALSYFDAVPRSWGLAPDDPYPEEPLVGLAEGRARALEAFRARRDGDMADAAE